ncbi:MAG: hypothetical protein R2787_04635 [Saprospiraceae bacterium]
MPNRFVFTQGRQQILFRWLFSIFFGIGLATTAMGQIQVLQFKLVDESMTICGDSVRVMVQFRKTTNDPVTGIGFAVTPYRGMTYLLNSYQNYAGDATGDNGDMDDPVLYFPDLTGPAGETWVDTFEMNIGCQVLPLGENEKVVIKGTVTADGGIMANATDIEVQLLQPALNLISIVDKITDGTLDSSYTRVTTFKNGGFGSLKTWKYWSISQSAIRMDSLMYYSSVTSSWIKLNAVTLPGNAPGVEDTMCYLLQPAECAMIGDADATFDLNEEIKIREHFTVLECDPDNNRTFITGSWGCGGEECDWVMDEAFVRFGRILPTLKTWVDTWRPPFCHGTSEVRKIYITNLEGNPAKDVILDLFSKYSTNVINGPVEMGSIDIPALLPVGRQRRSCRSHPHECTATGYDLEHLLPAMDRGVLSGESGVERGFCQVALPEIQKMTP